MIIGLAIQLGASALSGSVAPVIPSGFFLVFNDDKFLVYNDDKYLAYDAYGNEFSGELTTEFY